jgi:hypothetical protein
LIQNKIVLSKVKKNLFHIILVSLVSPQLTRVTIPSATKSGGHMSLRLGDEAPDFSQESTQGLIQFYQWLGNSWGVLFTSS